jgi:hypothetical protein
MKTIFVSLAAAMSLAGAVHAQQITTGHLAALDANGDGALDVAEFASFAGQAFAALDVNRDGYVTLVEAGTISITPEQFAAANANGDDGLSAQEFSDAIQADFVAADLDGNGSLD